MTPSAEILQSVVGYESQQEILSYTQLVGALGTPSQGPTINDPVGRGTGRTEKGEGKCCGKALKAAGVVESVSVVRIRAPKK